MFLPSWKNILQHSWFHVLFLLAVCFVIYGRILHAPFQFDDFGLLMRNPNIENFSYFLKNWQNLERKSLTFLTFAINYHIGKHDTFSYHLANVVLHFCTAAFLYFIVKNLLRTPVLTDSLYAKEKGLFAFFVAIVFLAHPLQTQSVTYIWQRSELLSGFFYLSAYGLYLEGRLRHRYGYFLLAGLAFYIGFFAKGTVVSLPILVVLTEFYFFAAPSEKKAIGAISLGAIGTFVLSLFITPPFRFILEKAHLGFLARNYQEISWDYLWTQFKVLMVYIRLAFVPMNQNVDYYFPNVRTFFHWPTVLSLLALAAIIGAAVHLYHRQRLMSFGIFWFFIYLLPTSFLYSLVDPIFEHRVYISMAGFGILAAALLFKYIPQARWRNSVMIVIIAGLCVLTVLRNNLWLSPVALMEDAIKKGPLNSRPYLNLGMYFYRIGDLTKAAEYFEKGLALRPYSIELNNNLGLIYRDRGDQERAQELFEKAISIKPDYVLSLINLAYLAMDRGALGDAEEYLNRAMQIERSDKTYTAFGYLYAARRNFDKAKDSFLTAIPYNPNNPKTYFGLGNVYFTQRDYGKALNMYQRVLDIDPAYYEARVNMMRVYQDMGDFENYRRMAAEMKKKPH